MAGINVPITVEAKQAKSAIREFNLDMKATENAYKATAAEAKASGSVIDELTAKQKMLSEQLQLQAGMTTTNKKAYDAQVASMAEYGKKVEAANEALKVARESGKSSAEEIEKLENAVSNANAQFDLSQKRVHEWERNIKNSDAA